MFLDSGPVLRLGAGFSPQDNDGVGAGFKPARARTALPPDAGSYALRLISSGSGAAAQRATYSLTDA